MEHEFIRWLERHVPRGSAQRVPIGDDAAVLRFPVGKELVVAADAVQDGVHFVADACGPEAIGRKAMAVNLSDLAAMAAEPVSAVVTLALPATGAAQLAEGILRGAWSLAQEFGIAICGGDTNCWPHPLSVSVTVLGGVDPNHAWLRSGGQVGDSLVVTGPLGGSLLGKHLTFQPLIREALAWRDAFSIRAATDISDGLAVDALAIASASGCGAALDIARVPVSDAARQAARQSGRAPLQHALEDGEDFELLLAMAPEEAKRFCGQNVAAAVVGELVAQHGLWSRKQEQLEPLQAKGFEHH